MSVRNLEYINRILPIRDRVSFHGCVTINVGISVVLMILGKVIPRVLCGISLIQNEVWVWISSVIRIGSGMKINITYTVKTVSRNFIKGIVPLPKVIIMSGVRVITSPFIRSDTLLLFVLIFFFYSKYLFT